MYKWLSNTFINIGFFNKIYKISVRIWTILGSTSRGRPADQFLDVQKWSLCCLGTRQRLVLLSVAGSAEEQSVRRHGGGTWGIGEGP